MPLNQEEQTDRVAEKALEDQKEAEKKAIAEQQQVRDKLTADVLAREKDQLESYHANKDLHGLPAAPKEPATLESLDDAQQKSQQEEKGKRALSAYKEAGFIATRDTMTAPGMTPADHALTAEKAFRERQQQLADKISDPQTSPEQRERLGLVKTTEYHTHKAEQMGNIISMERDMMGYSFGHQEVGEKAIGKHQGQLDHHKSQAVLAAHKLHEFDQKKGLVPKEVQARMGHAAQQPQIQHNTQSQKDQSRDPHLDSLTPKEQGKGKAAEKNLPEAQNPAAKRLLARIQSAGERNDAKTTPEMDQRMKEIGANHEKLAASQELKKAESLGHKAELEQRAATRR